MGSRLQGLSIKTCGRAPFIHRKCIEFHWEVNVLCHFVGLRCDAMEHA